MLAIGRCSARLIPAPFDLAKVEMLDEANHDRSEFRAFFIELDIYVLMYYIQAAPRVLADAFSRAFRSDLTTRSERSD